VNPIPTPAGKKSQERKPRPPVFLNKKPATLGTGRRKTAVARVFVTEGTGKIVINNKPLDQYFTETKDRNAVIGPLAVLDMANRLDLTIKVQGGGFTGQAGACCQGIARALKTMFNLETATQPVPEGGQAPDENIINMAKKLRDSGYLTRDGRMKERKKYGLKGARKAFQFSKR